MRSWGIGLGLLLCAACSSGEDGAVAVEMEPFEDEGGKVPTLLPPELPTLPPIDQLEPDAAVVPNHGMLDAAGMIDDGSGDAAPIEDAMAPEAAADAAQAARIELSQLIVSGTPTNSFRMGAWGYDPQHGLCIMVVWYFHDIEQRRYCMHQPELEVPYVVIEAMADPVVSDPKWSSTNPPCWEYSGNVSVLEQRGCADFGDLSDPAQYAIDAEIDVAGAAFTGTIHFVH